MSDNGKHHRIILGRLFSATAGSPRAESNVDMLRLPSPASTPFSSSLRVTVCFALGLTAATARAQDEAEGSRQGKSPVELAQQEGDWSHDAPGTRHHINLAALPPTFATESVRNGPKEVHRPDGAMPQVPKGFKIEVYAAGLKNPRYLQTAPNGDIFVAETGGSRIKVLHGTDGSGHVAAPELFADSGLNKPFGLAFYPAGPDPQYLYVANTDSVVRFPYHSGDLKATGPAEKLPASIIGGGGHSTRALAFSPDGKRLYVTVGSGSNVDEGNNPKERERALVWEMNPDGTGQKIFGYGIRNPVGLAIRPGTEEVWVSTNERDGLGDDLVPDYVTQVKPGGFYGWPWFYMGNHQDPRKMGMHPELADKVLLPDVPVQSHSASLNLTFYTGSQFPSEYKGDAFACFHGSWNRDKRTGYKVIRAPIDKTTGKARGDYEDFVTGFVTPEGNVWGRPVGITVAKDGALLFSDDTTNNIWRVSYAGN